MVIDLQNLLSGEFVAVRMELASVVRAVRMKSVNTGRGQGIVKAIIETCYLTNKMKRLACKICEQAGVDFVKTSTGTGPRGATVHDVELLRRLPWASRWASRRRAASACCATPSS